MKTEAVQNPLKRGWIAHDLKIWPQYFADVQSGAKTFEVRKSDRDFRVGDSLRLWHYDPETELENGACIECEVKYILHGPGFGIEDGFCVMAIKPIWSQGSNASSDRIPGHTENPPAPVVDQKRLVRRGLADELTLQTATEQHGDYWGLNVLVRKDGQHVCYCCNAPATGRSSMNIWGTVVDFETCEECHEKFDGKRADSIPTSNSDCAPSD